MRRVLGGDHPITRNVELTLRESREALRGRLECAKKVLRFAVGTRVECSVDGLGGWHKGRVVKHWYRESDMPPGLFMPYQIELDREHDRGKLICANHDDDRMIRRAID